MRKGFWKMHNAVSKVLEKDNAVVLGREHIARLAEADGELTFAREVRAGCWDHRRDVANALERHRVKK